MNARILTISIASAISVSYALFSAAADPKTLQEQMEKMQKAREAASNRSTPRFTPPVPQHMYAPPSVPAYRQATPSYQPNTVTRNDVPQQNYAPRTNSEQRTSYTQQSSSMAHSTSYTSHSSGSATTSSTAHPSPVATYLLDASANPAPTSSPGDSMSPGRSSSTDSDGGGVDDASATPNVNGSVFGGTTSDGGNMTCDGYPLQTKGTGPAGMVCRCVYGGPSNQVGWWAVVPGKIDSAAVQCGPPATLASRVLQPQSSIQQQPAVTQPHVSKASQQQSLAKSGSSNSSTASYHPSFQDHGIVQDDPDQTLAFSGGVPVSDYIVRVVNTGDVRLACNASASALVSSGAGGSCIGQSAENCAAGQQLNTSNTAYVYPGNTSDVVKIRYYLQNGTYQVSCKAQP